MSFKIPEADPDHKDWPKWLTSFMRAFIALVSLSLAILFNFFATFLAYCVYADLIMSGEYIMIFGLLFLLIFWFASLLFTLFGRYLLFLEDYKHSSYSISKIHFILFNGSYIIAFLLGLFGYCPELCKF